MPSGSYLAITHPTPDFNAEETGGAVAAAEAAGITLVPRGQAEIERVLQPTWTWSTPG